MSGKKALKYRNHTDPYKDLNRHEIVATAAIATAATVSLRMPVPLPLLCLPQGPLPLLRVILRRMPPHNSYIALAGKSQP